MADSRSRTILVINCGSSSIKFALFDFPAGKVRATGLADRVGSSAAEVTLQIGDIRTNVPLPSAGHARALQEIIRALNSILEGTLHLDDIGHRVVHGGEFVSGAVHSSANTVRPALKRIKSRPGTKVVSSNFFMCLPDQVFIYGDCAAEKTPDSPVAGRATVFVVPDLNTGNTTYKAVQRSANVISIGPMLQGLKRPVNDLSRGALVEDIIYTIALTAIQAEQNIDVLSH